MLGIDALPLIAIPHPLADNSQELIEAKVQGVVQEIEFALTGAQEDLNHRYAGKFLHLAERRLTGGAVCVDEVCAIDPAASISAPNEEVR